MDTPEERDNQRREHWSLIDARERDWDAIQILAERYGQREAYLRWIRVETEFAKSDAPRF